MRVHIKMASNNLGDTLGASPYFEQYRVANNCELFVTCRFADLFASLYPEIVFNPKDQNFDKKLELRYFFDKPLQKVYTDQLGLPFKEAAPKVIKTNLPRPIAQKYVCFSAHSTAQAKFWNYPGGWEKLCDLLLSKNILPVSIDKNLEFGSQTNRNRLPDNCVKAIGFPLDKAINYLEHAELFVGLSSGLSWLAHAVGTHVVMISGTTHTWCEFQENITRIINTSVCHGCFNAPKQTPFVAADWTWCPLHKGTDRHFECSKSISPELVFNNILNKLSL